MPRQNNMGTYTLPVGSYPIVGDDGVRVLSMTLSVGGAATVQGTAKIGSMGLSTAVALIPGLPTVLSNEDPIDGLTLVVTVGTVTVFTNQ